MASDGDGGDSTWTRPGVFLSIAFLVFALIGGGFVLVRSHSSTPAVAAVASASAVGVSTGTPSPTYSSSTTPTPANTASTATASAVALPDQAIPVTAPPATWITVVTLSLPTSPRYGPKINDGTVMAGYEHSPTGALFADADNAARFAVVPDWRTATLSAVADTPGRAAFLAQRAAYGVITPTPGEFTQLAGFNYLSYTPDKAIVQVIRANGDGQFVVSVDTILWQGNDWKVSLPESGQLAAGTVAQSAAGFVPWKDNR